jgi:Exosome component EXOSC1/CSL4.
VHRWHCSDSTVPSSPAQRRCSCYREGQSRNDKELQTRRYYISQGCILL